MMSHEERLEQYENMMFGLLMESVAKEDGRKLEGYNQGLLDNPDCAIPEEADTKSMRAIWNYFEKQSRKESHRSILRR